MDVTAFFVAFLSFIRSVLQLLASKAVFTVYGYHVSVLQLLGALIVLSMVVGLFWRGAKG